MEWTRLNVLGGGERSRTWRRTRPWGGGDGGRRRANGCVRKSSVDVYGCMVVLVYGEDDFQCDPVSQGGRAHAALPGSRFEVIADAGHMPWVEQPAAFAEVIRHWFEHVRS